MKLRVDLRAALSIVGSVLKWLSIPVCIPLAIALYELQDVIPFLVTAALLFGCGVAMETLEDEPELRIREGFLVVALTWLSCAIFGAIPFLVAGKGTLAQPMNALFESMSGFTTTGATVVANISFDTYSLSLMMWRQMIQWLGGMGIIVLAVAILPRLSVGGTELMKMEAPGPDVERLAPRIADTAKRLWIVYVGLTILEMGILYLLHLRGLAPNMTLYNSIAHGFTTMPTGGFSPEARSIEAFSAYAQWTIIPFMFLAGTNFALLWKLCSGKASSLLENIEFRVYGTIVVCASLILFLVLLVNVPKFDIEETVRHAVFQVLTIVTTTGYASADFNQWGGMVKTILFLAMFIGGCSGSTGGGIKIIRWVVGVKEMLRELFVSIHPHAIRPIRVGKKVLEDRTSRRIVAFILFYFFLFLLGTSLVYVDEIRVGLNTDPLEVMSTTAACLGNIGPGFGLVGPMSNYNAYSSISKFILFLLMWFGRLEIITVCVIFLPAYWTR